MTQSHANDGLDALESRTLFSTYLFQGVGDVFNLGRAVLEVSAPDGAVGFGAVVAGLGDLDGDGRDDFAVAAPGDATGAPNGAAGSVFIYSGTGLLIRTLTDGAPGFGMSMTRIADFNDDGIPDLLIGSPWQDATADAVHNPTGAAQIYSGADGALLRTLMGSAALGEFGRVVARTSDWDNDAALDFVVAAPAGGEAGAGQVTVFAGFGAGVLRVLDGTQAGERFGDAIGANTIGPGSNEPTIAISAPNWTSETGRVYQFATDGSVLRTLEGAEAGERFGAALALVLQGDFNGNTIFTVLVGAPGADDYRGQFGNAIENRGRIDQFGGTTTDAGTQFIGKLTNERLGETIAGAGRLSADGTDDFIVTAPGNPNTPVQYLISTEGVQWALRDRPQMNFYLTSLDVLNGSAFAGAGDVNDDGFDDVITATTSGAGRVSIVSSLALGDSFVVDGASPDQSRIWGHTGDLSLIFIDGAPTPFSRIPGLTPIPPRGDNTTPYSHVQGVLNDGTILFFNQPRNESSRTELFLLNEGVATPLSELVTSIVGTTDGPDFTALSVAATNSAGHLALVGADNRVWVFRDGVLTFTWSGSVSNMNSSGAIVGFTIGEGARVWTPEGGVMEIEGMAAGAINDQGQVVGTINDTSTGHNPGTIGVWDDGVITVITPGPDINAGSGSPLTWVFRDFDDSGRILADVNIPQVRTSISARQTYLYEPDDGLRALGDAVYGLPVAEWTAGYSFAPFNNWPLPTIAFGPDGSILALDTVFTQIDDALPFTLREGAPVANITSGGTAHVIGVNIYGDVVAFSRNGDAWIGRRLTGGVRTDDPIGIAAVADPQDNNAPYAIVSHDGLLENFGLVPNTHGFPDDGSINGFADQTAIVRGLTVFTNAVGVVHVAGIAANGDVVIYFRSSTYLFTSPLGWTFDNLSQTHLQPQGLETPDFVGGLSAFATPWQGMNINGVDAAGEVHSIWWAPGQLLWSVTNLTEAADAGPVHGEITSFATAWGTLHVNAIDEDGDITAIWWAEGFGGAWRHDKLLDGGVALDPSSLTSFTTPWGGLNIAGRDAMTGEVVVYWWSPASNVWTDEHLEFRDGAASPTLSGRLSSNVSAEGVMSIAASGADDTAFRMSWQPGDGPWTLEDLTELTT